MVMAFGKFRGRNLFCKYYSNMTILFCLLDVLFYIFSFIRFLSSNICLMLIIHLQLDISRSIFCHKQLLKKKTVTLSKMNHINCIEILKENRIRNGKISIVNSLRSDKLVFYLFINFIPKSLIIFRISSIVLCISPRISHPHNFLFYLT